MASSSRRSASASWATAMNALLRWDTSITDMPLPFQSVISAFAVSKTSRGSVAGPAAKLNTRMNQTSRCGPYCPTVNTPGRYCPGARNISGRRRSGRDFVAIAERIGDRIRGAGFVDEVVDALDPRQALALAQPDEPHALRIATHDRDLADRRAHQRAR